MAAERRSLSTPPSRSPSPEQWTAGDAFLDSEVAAKKKRPMGFFSTGKAYVLRAWGMTSRRMRATLGVALFLFVILLLWRPSLKGLKYRPVIPGITPTYGDHPESTHPDEFQNESPYHDDDFSEIADPVTSPIATPIPEPVSDPVLPPVFNSGSLKFNETKVALLIENRPNPILAPLMIHFMGVVPPDWRFRFMGSQESVESINKSVAIRNQVARGKLDLTYIPSNMSTTGQEMISRFLTTRWLYEQVLYPAEHLLVFQTDSILCANSRGSINEWLDYDWVGAPWNPNGDWGGNGGLSLRKVSSILDILRSETRIDNDGPEDVWLASRLARRPGAKMANGTVSLSFSAEQHRGVSEHVGPVEPGYVAQGGVLATSPEYFPGIDDWRDGFYEPLGYHTGDNGKTLHGANYGRPEQRQHIWKYCPEIKIMFSPYMDAEEYVPGHCKAHWKRGESGLLEPRVVNGLQQGRWDPNIVDEEGYPYLPATFQPW